MESQDLILTGIGTLVAVITVQNTLARQAGAWRWEEPIDFDMGGGIRLITIKGHRIGGTAAYDVTVRAPSGVQLLPDQSDSHMCVEAGRSVHWRLHVPASVPEPVITVRWRNGVQRWRISRSKRFTFSTRRR